jgi:hypothetical protein
MLLLGNHPVDNGFERIKYLLVYFFDELLLFSPNNGVFGHLADRFHHFVEHANNRKHRFLIVLVWIGQLPDVHDYHSIEDFVYCFQAIIVFLKLLNELICKEVFELNRERKRALGDDILELLWNFMHKRAFVANGCINSEVYLACWSLQRNQNTLIA